MTLILSIRIVGGGLFFVARRSVVRGQRLLRKPFKMSVHLVTTTGHARYRDTLGRGTNDLHAADGRYHTECYTNFYSPRSVKSASAASSSSQEEVDVAFETTVSAVRAESWRVWKIGIPSNYTTYTSPMVEETLVAELGYQIFRILWFGSSCAERHRCC